MRNRPEQVKAAILVEQNERLIVDKIELPDRLFTGQVLVEVECSGICGSQIGEIAGVKGEDKYLPHLMGHEGCGTVLDIGEGVSEINVGDKVVLHWRKGIGLESVTPKYLWRGKSLNAGWVTTFNTHAIVSENRCTKVATSTSPELASLFGCAITTGFGVVENNAKIKMGESVVVFGAGGVGLNIIQASYLHSAYPIIAVDIYDNRLNLAKELGATHVLNSKNSDVFQEILKISKNENIDVFIDNTGNTKVIEEGYKIIKRNGRLILVGVPKRGNNINIFTLPLHFGKTIIGSHGGESNPNEDIKRYLQLFNQNIAQYNKIITERYSLDNINEAIDAMKKGETAGRILIEMK